jgi:hypothetical protein
MQLKKHNFLESAEERDRAQTLATTTTHSQPLKQYTEANQKVARHSHSTEPMSHQHTLARQIPQKDNRLPTIPMLTDRQNT